MRRPNQWLDPDVRLKPVMQGTNPFEAHPALRKIWSDERSAHAEADTVHDLALGINSDPHLNQVDLIVDRAGEVVGITGFYRPVPDDETRIGLRWHGIVPEHRGKGYSDLAVDAVCRVAVSYHPCATEIVEYVPLADRANGHRLRAYFERLGFVADPAPKDASAFPPGLSLPGDSGDWLPMRRSLLPEQALQGGPIAV